MRKNAFLALSCLTALVYFTWRVQVLNPAYAAYAWIVLCAEIVGFVRVLAFQGLAAPVKRRDAPAARPGLAVDVFITTYDEPLHIVHRSVTAAIAIRYPHETWLLDDGDRLEMRRLARDLGCRYLGRANGSDAKAGNLNHALEHARGALVAVFDADHVADPRFLDRTIGYFRDERVAFVQTPQAFSNVDSFAHLSRGPASANESSLFDNVVQRSRDAANAVVFCGSAAVLRRLALDEIAGFATGTVTEDVHTSLRLHAAGWLSVYHPEILSTGIAPLDGAAYFVQRLRWAQGAVQLAWRENLTRYPGLTWQQRQSYLIHVASNLEGWRHLFIYALPIAILVTGIVPVATDAASFALFFTPYFLATLLAGENVAQHHGQRRFEKAVYDLARCPVSIFAAFTGRRTLRFAVTPKTRGPRRSDPGSAFAWLILLLTSGAIVFALARAYAGRSPLDAGVLALVLAWAAVHVTTAARLLVHAHRCASVDADIPERVEIAVRKSPERDHRFGTDDAGAGSDHLGHEFA